VFTKNKSRHALTFLYILYLLIFQIKQVLSRLNQLSLKIDRMHVFTLTKIINEYLIKFKFQASLLRVKRAASNVLIYFLDLIDTL